MPLILCLSPITFVRAAFLDLSSKELTGALPSELGNLSELSECFNCVTRAYAALHLVARTNWHCLCDSLMLRLSIHFFLLRSIFGFVEQQIHRGHSK